MRARVAPRGRRTWMQPLLDRCAPAQFAHCPLTQHAPGVAHGVWDSDMIMPRSPVGCAGSGTPS